MNIGDGLSQAQIPTGGQETKKGDSRRQPDLLQAPPKSAPRSHVEEEAARIFFEEYKKLEGFLNFITEMGGEEAAFEKLKGRPIAPIERNMVEGGQLAARVFQEVEGGLEPGFIGETLIRMGKIRAAYFRKVANDDLLTFAEFIPRLIRASREVYKPLITLARIYGGLKQEEIDGLAGMPQKEKMQALNRLLNNIYSKKLIGMGCVPKNNELPVAITLLMNRHLPELLKILEEKNCASDEKMARFLNLPSVKDTLFDLENVASDLDNLRLAFGMEKAPAKTLFSKLANAKLLEEPETPSKEILDGLEKVICASQYIESDEKFMRTLERLVRISEAVFVPVMQTVHMAGGEELQPSEIPNYTADTRGEWDSFVNEAVFGMTGNWGEKQNENGLPFAVMMLISMHRKEFEAAVIGEKDSLRIFEAFIVNPKVRQSALKLEKVASIEDLKECYGLRGEGNYKLVITAISCPWLVEHYGLEGLREKLKK